PRAPVWRRVARDGGDEPRDGDSVVAGRDRRVRGGDRRRAEAVRRRSRIGGLVRGRPPRPQLDFLPRVRARDPSPARHQGPAGAGRPYDLTTSIQSRLWPQSLDAFAGATSVTPLAPLNGAKMTGPIP